LLDQLQRAAAAVDPHAIDHAAERAVEKVVRAVRGDDANGGSKGTPRKPGGWTKKELMDQADVSATVFDRIRKAASVKPSEKGGRGTQRRFSNAELRKLIAAVEAGTHRRKREIVKDWSELLPGDREASHQ
jgi:hypothetical protein